MRLEKFQPPSSSGECVETLLQKKCIVKWRIAADRLCTQSANNTIVECWAVEEMREAMPIWNNATKYDRFENRKTSEWIEECHCVSVNRVKNIFLFYCCSVNVSTVCRDGPLLLRKSNQLRKRNWVLNVQAATEGMGIGQVIIIHRPLKGDRTQS